MSDPSLPVEKATPRFLFATIFAIYFFSGGVFVVFSVPLIVSVALDQTFAGPSDVVLRGLVDFWAPIVKNPNASVVLASLLFLSLVVGLIIEPIDRTVSKLSLSFFGRVYRDANPRSFGPPPLTFKTARNHNDYAEYLAWLVTQKHACAHWELELFLYHLRWSLCTNALIFIGFYTRLIWAKSSTIELLSYSAIPIVLFVAYGVLRSRALGAVNEYYWAKMKTLPSTPTSTAAAD